MSTWKAEEIQLLIELWGENYSEGEIAQKLNRSRCAIGGKLQREREKGHITAPHVYIKQKQPGVTDTGNRRRKPWKPAMSASLPPPPDGTTTIVRKRQPQLSSRPCSIRDLDDTLCRWPIGDPRNADFHYCGSATTTGSKYCDYHTREAYPHRPVYAPEINP